MRVLDLFSGIGGFSLGLERAGMKTVGFCEIEPVARAVLEHHWPGVPINDDVTTRQFTPGEADVICGGFPCQDISGAGKRAGLAGARSGLFRELLRAIRVVGPRFTIMENVADLLHRGMGEVCGELADCGLRVEWDCLPAYSVGAPHQRERVWIVAYPDAGQRQAGWAPAIRRGQPGAGAGAGVGHNSDANRQGELQPGWCFKEFWGRPVYRGEGSDQWRTHWLDRLNALRRVDDGVSRRLDEAKELGNAVIPQIPEMIGRAIMAAV